MDGIRRSFYYISLFFDLIILSFSFILADFISRGRLPLEIQGDMEGVGLPEIFTIFMFILVWFFSAKIISLYDELKNFGFISEVFSLLKTVSVQFVAGVIILFSLKSILLSRYFLLIYLVILFFSMFFLRAVYRVVRRIIIAKGKITKNVLVVGSNEIGLKLFGTKEQSEAMGYRIQGFIADHPVPNGKLKCMGTFDDLGEIIVKHNINEVLIALKGEESKMLNTVTKILSGFPVRARIIPEYFKFISNKYQISFFNDIPVIDIRNDPLDELHWRIIKRGFDLVFSLLFLLLIFSWLGLLIAIAIKVSSSGSVFFKQERWGRKNKKFILYKFRSMIKESKDVDVDGKFIQATKSDSRVTAVGKFLRRTSLDEIPQFFNVLKGDMSVIGPRPHAVPMNIESKDSIENYMLRHLVKPGITGWAQVNGLRGATKDKKLLEKRIEYDMFYIENWSMWLDLRVIFLTVWRGVRGDPNAY